MHMTFEIRFDFYTQQPEGGPYYASEEADIDELQVNNITSNANSLGWNRVRVCCSNIG